MVSFGDTKHFEDVCNSIRVFMELSILPLTLDTKLHVQKELFRQAQKFIIPLGKVCTKHYW